MGYFKDLLGEVDPFVSYSDQLMSELTQQSLPDHAQQELVKPTDEEIKATFFS